MAGGAKLQGFVVSWTGRVLECSAPPGTADLRLHDFSAAQTRCADTDALALAVHFRVHRTQIHIPAPLGDVVGVADAVSRLRLLAADITLLCHDYSRSLPIDRGKETFYRDAKEFSNRRRQKVGSPIPSTIQEHKATRSVETPVPLVAFVIGQEAAAKNKGPGIPGANSFGLYNLTAMSQAGGQVTVVEASFLLRPTEPAVPNRSVARRDSNPHLLPSQGAGVPLPHAPSLFWRGEFL
jgi:hypothetical protein